MYHLYSEKVPSAVCKHTHTHTHFLLLATVQAVKTTSDSPAAYSFKEKEVNLFI